MINHYNRQNFTAISQMFEQIYLDFMSSGKFLTIYKDVTKFTLETSPVLDYTYEVLPWRVHFDSSYLLYYRVYDQDSIRDDKLDIVKEFGRIVVGTSDNLPDDGNAYEQEINYMQDIPDVPILPTLPTLSADATPEQVASYLLEMDKYNSDLQQYNEVLAARATALSGFVANARNDMSFSDFMLTVDQSLLPITQIDNEGIRFKNSHENPHPVGDISPLLTELTINSTRPTNYLLSISDTGFAIVFNSQGDIHGRGTKWICCQRLVDSYTGNATYDYYSPVICLTNHIERPYINSLDINTVWQIVIREVDVTMPSVAVKVNIFSDFVDAYWNTHKQQSTSSDTESGVPVLTFPDGINTERHLYDNKCIDLIAFINANKYAEGNICSLSLYNPDIENKFIASRSTINYNEGQRLMLRIS